MHDRADRLALCWRSGPAQARRNRDGSTLQQLYVFADSSSLKLQVDRPDDATDISRCSSVMRFFFGLLQAFSTSLTL
jgi:hypothetical protein